MIQLWKDQAKNWFENLQQSICHMLEAFEMQSQSHHVFEKKTWKRTDESQQHADGGGGKMAVLRGDVFEKAGVNVSTVFGCFDKKFCDQIPGTQNNPSFWASGISLVIHPKNPYIPIIHMNTRMIVTEKIWFGGGVDLTPVFPDDVDTHYFHQTLEKMCQTYDETFYPDFSKWCDEYFYIKHRQESRGVGGIFYDYQFVENDSDFVKLFSFTKDVGKTFENIYQTIVQRHIDKTWGEEEEHAQSLKRSRYVEFNLVYDRGTQFGFKTGGNTEAILMSMPPKAIWP